MFAGGIRRFSAGGIPAMVITTLALLALTVFGVRQYEFNVSGLLHMDKTFGDAHQVPSGLVLYTDGAYDGMLYYEVARELPALIAGRKTALDSPYRFQRVLLPALVYVLTFGNAKWFPLAFVLINIACAIISLWLMLRLTKGKTLHALTIVANPAILVGILFTLTEPLSLLLMVVFFWVWLKNDQKLSPFSVLLLILSLLARETTVFLIGLLFLWYIWGKQWRQALLIVIPMIILAGWQFFLEQRLGAVGFQANSNIVSFPFGGPLQAIRWLIEGKKVSYVLTSVALMAFVFPLGLVLAKEWLNKRTRIGVLAFLLSGLTATMLSMDPHMWGVITSIGRVVTPIYPVYVLYASERDTPALRALSIVLIVVSVLSAIGIAYVRHPYVIS
jgi:hypothetical protein